MASDDAISRLNSPPNSPYLCTCCTEAIQDLEDECSIACHMTYSGFLEAVANKCFICWRLFHALDSIRQECLQTVARYEHLGHLKCDYFKESTSLYSDWTLGAHPIIRVCSDLHPNRGAWSFDPEILPDLAHAIEVMDQARDISFDHFLIKMDSGTEVSEISQWIKSCVGSVGATAWEETIDLIRRWLQDCSSHHAQCVGRAKDTSWFPTRVLDLGPLEPAMSDETTVKIITREKVVPGNRYVTLSHRWTPFIPKLTSQNLEAWSHQLPVEGLTKTFRDFITVTRLLGFRYAWIDSLCIIQESDHGGSDWSHECLTMDLVYRNSFCNLSADWGTHSDGLFLDRRARQFDLPIVSGNLPIMEDNEDSKTSENSENSENSEDGEKQESKYLLVDCGTWQHEVTNSPINSRGWVFQERFLSPRVLHFCRNEVIFECCEASKSERFRQSIPVIDKILYQPFKNFDENFLGKHDTATCHRVWNRIPGIYTRCALTFASDKLVAILGIARYLKTFLVDDVYVMGVWASAISTQMLWWCDENTIRDHSIDPRTLGELEPLSNPTGQTLSTPLRQCKGPTFSWVSTDLPVALFGTISKLFCECIRLVKYREGQAPSDDEPITEDIFNYSHDPMVELKVAGSLYRVRLIDTGMEYLAAVFLDGDDCRPGNYESSRSIRDDHTVFLDFPISPSEIPKIESRVFFCMPWATENATYRSWTILTSIILELVDPEMGRFRRIGTISSFEINRQPEANLPCWSYDPERRLYTIYII
ncbi:hypothetical protein MRS44_002167 [Fusarium solani]|uniref:uncharacterized protein n=1 Tax=Fusarium solani TaxID=169388 RepID=UPI0032C48B51|nr:hypothetical protein MRS44_002167 [Fusarium solani]